MTAAPVRLALVGVSGYAAQHYEFACRQARDGTARLLAATVINPADEPDKCRDLRELGCELFTDFREMLRAFHGQLDLCLIPTAIGWHAPMTVAALEAGASVLVEKPLAGDLSGADSIRAAEARAGENCFVAVGFQDLYPPGAHRLKAALLRGEIGELRRVRFRAAWPRGRRYFQRAAWAGRLEHQGVTVNDSPLNNALAHPLNLALFLAGPSPLESAGATLLDADLLRVNPIESFDTAALWARLSTGAELFCAVSHACEQRLDPVLVLEGTRGEARWEHQGTLTITPTDGEPVSEPVATATEAREAMFAQVMRRLTDPHARICTTGNARRHTELIDTLHRRFPIRTVPARFVRERPLGDDTLLAVDGMTTGLETAFREAALFRETGASWATSAL